MVAKREGGSAAASPAAVHSATVAAPLAAAASSPVRAASATEGAVPSAVLVVVGNVSRADVASRHARRLSRRASRSKNSAHGWVAKQSENSSREEDVQRRGAPRRDSSQGAQRSERRQGSQATQLDLQKISRETHDTCNWHTLQHPKCGQIRRATRHLSSAPAASQAGGVNVEDAQEAFTPHPWTHQ